MNKVRNIALSGMSVMMLGLVVACGDGPPPPEGPEQNGSEADQPSGDEAGMPTEGGTITAALGGDPQTMDQGVNSGALTNLVAWNIFESLFAMDEEYLPQPMLAESYDVSEDGLEYTIHLRDGVVFHNGDSMNSSDVVASLQRWTEVSATGQQAGEAIESIAAVDELTVSITLSVPRYSLISDLAFTTQMAIIIPEEIADEVGTTPMNAEQTVGTGPYQLAEYNEGQHVLLERFDEYASLEDDLGGFAGAKHAWADEIEYVFVPDETQRFNGVQTGQFDWVQSINADDYESARNHESLNAIPSARGTINTVLVNHNESSLFDDVRAREAINLIIDKDVFAAATFGPEWVWEPLSNSFVSPDNATMYSDAGEDIFFDYDPDRAAELFAEAGIDGSEPIRMLTSQTYPQFYQWAVMIQAELDELGIPMEIDVYDYPTIADMRSSEPESWDLSTSFFTGAVTSPDQILWLGGDWAGEYSNDERDELMAQYQESTSPEEALAVATEIQQLVYEDFPVVQLGHVSEVNVHSAELIFPDDWTNVLYNAGYGE
ncbi:ABC transporter substrate-binding protein [Nesterenkonia ebinurensis]|uniref:ABC transporter substrate-binding protein n=1 Tax=Nesterenkonia ebinurensis TaxID=2608252 RepID=UPI00123D1F23|nr:ABC transporter substrate-binding protein [Nesterenkonia ebinurensis]